MAFGHDHCRCLNISLSVNSGEVLWENVRSQFPKQPWFFWHHSVTLHGPCPFPPLGCVARSDFTGELSSCPLPQFPVPKRGGRKGGWSYRCLPTVWAQGQPSFIYSNAVSLKISVPCFCQAGLWCDTVIHTIDVTSRIKCEFGLICYY